MFTRTILVEATHAALLVVVAGTRPHLTALTALIYLDPIQTIPTITIHLQLNKHKHTIPMTPVQSYFFFPMTA